jgi:uncharacterized protein YqeY
MTSATRQRVLDDIKVAMKAGDKQRLGTLRLVSAAIKQREVDERVEVDEPAMIAMLDKLMKQRRESVTQYKAAGRDDLVAVEEAEMAIISDYLPAGLSDAEIDQAIDDAVSSSGAASVKDMGSVMAILKPALTGRADLSDVSRRVKARLGT